ncbi:Ger(x)C family spore germination protein [Paenibacillus montanisoli]|nr:Ger(x)C family spore germination protein [Paenibacillus montanisoli]
MKRGIKFAACLSLLPMLLTGCWDIQNLTNKKLVNGLSLDLVGNDQMMGTIRTIVLESKGGGQFDAKDEVIKAVGASVYLIGYKIDNMLPGTLEASKTHVVIIGEELAKKGVMAPLEPFYRNPKFFLKADLIISKGMASEVLSFNKIDNSPVAFGIKQILHSAARKTVVPKQTLYSLWSEVSTQGEDAIVPMIRKVNETALTVDGICLFDGDRYSGVTLERADSTILLLMDGTLNAQATMNIPIEQGMSTILVRKLKRSIHVTANGSTGKIECSVHVDLYGAIASLPSRMDREIDRKQVNQEMADWLNKESSVVTAKLRQANCDALGIGRRLRVKYPELWRSMDREQKYQNVVIKPSFTVHINSTGVLN